MLNWTVGAPPVVIDPLEIDEIRPLTWETKLPLPLILAKSNPNCRSLVRETSMILTCKSPCCTPLTFMLLMILG